MSTIALDGEDVTTMDRGALRGRVGAVLEDFVHFHFTVAENVGLGWLPDLSDQIRIEQVDRIVVLDDGRVVGQGTHAELMAHDGLYAKMFRMQAAGYDIAPVAAGDAAWHCHRGSYCDGRPCRFRSTSPRTQATRRDPTRLATMASRVWPAASFAPPAWRSL